MNEAVGSFIVPPSATGFVILAVIAVPVALLLMAAMFGSPRNARLPVLFMGAAVMLVGGTIVGFAAIGALLSHVVPG
jgi:hypothetical protein